MNIFRHDSQILRSSVTNRVGTACLVTIGLLLLAATPVRAQEIEQEITNASQHVVVVLDDSGSMNDPMRQDRSITKMEAAKQALIVVIESLPADSQVGIIALNGRVGNPRSDNWIVPLGPINKPEAVQAIKSLGAKGGTPLGAFMKIGTDSLLQARSKDHYGSYRLLMVTDGEAGDEKRVEGFLPDILARGITTDVIGVDMKSQHSLATKVHTYRRADDPESLTRAVREVFAETSTDATDTGVDDFDLVAGLPDDVAAAAIDALSVRENHPIGTRASVVGSTGLDSMLGTGNGNSNAAGGNSHRATGSTAVPPSHQNQSHRTHPKRGPSPFLIVFIAFVLFSLAKAALSGGKRR